MTLTRRDLLLSSAASAGFAALPFASHAASHGGGDMLETAKGSVKIHPIHHASVVLETPAGVIYVDPVGDPAEYAGQPPADLILVTHEHGDHFNADTLSALGKEGAPLITNPAVHGKLAAELQARASHIANGESTAFGAVSIDAIPAYNTTAGKEKFHPKGRDNGYVLSMGDLRIYLSGDTEDIPEMRALEGIDLAFVCMNLPFTMPAEAAADAVRAFKPTVVYPYHYRGRDGGTQDPAEFARLVGDAAEVRMGSWYKPGELG